VHKYKNYLQVSVSFELALIADEAPEDQPKPFECNWKDTIRTKFPCLVKDEMGVLLEFLDRALQMDPSKRAAPSDLLNMAWLQSQLPAWTEEEV